MTMTRSPVRVSQRVSPAARDPRESAALGLLGVALVVQILLSTVEISSVQTTFGSLYYAQLLSIPLLLCAPSGDVVVRSTARRSLWLLILFGALAVPSILAHSPAGRLLPVLQLSINVVVLLATLGVARRLSTGQLRRAVTVSASILGAVAAFQALFMSGGIRGSNARVLGIPRPSVLFQEPTWLALTLALLAAAAAQLQARRTAGGLGLFVVFLWTRAAVLLLGLSLLTRVLPRRRGRWAILVVSVVVMIAEVWYVLSLIATPFVPVQGKGSLITRIRDVWVVSRANGGDFWPWGGGILRVFDRTRFRDVPQTSNVLPFELIWKFGLGGIAMFAVLAAFFLAVSGPVATLARGRGVGEPAGAALLAIPIVGAFNNCLGRTWLWTLSAVLIAALAAPPLNRAGRAAPPTAQVGSAPKRRAG